MRLLGVLVLVLLTAVPTFAQDSDPPLEGPPSPLPPEVIARDAQGRITVRANRVSSPFVFDGVLEEPFYREIPPFGDFIQQEPHEGQPATDKTEVWVFFDRDNLYVSARMYDADPGKRIATEMRRDANNLYNNDHFGVSFDGFYDRRNGYGFAVNALGGMLDWFVDLIWAGVSSVPAVFVEEGTPTFTLMRTMIAIVLMVFVVYLIAMRPFRSVIRRAVKAMLALLQRRA